MIRVTKLKRAPLLRRDPWFRVEWAWGEHYAYRDISEADLRDLVDKSKNALDRLDAHRAATAESEAPDQGRDVTFDRLTPESADVLRRSMREALSVGNSRIDVSHISAAIERHQQSPTPVRS